MISTIPKFNLGQTVITTTALAAITTGDIQNALCRHVSGDWGDLSQKDREENECSLLHGFRLLSAYHSDNGIKFWIITESDRSVTTVLLRADY